MRAVSTALFAFMISCVAVTSSTYYPSVKYVDAPCGRIIYVNSDVRIKLSSSLLLTGSSPCTITLKPVDGTALVATFLTYNMYSGYVNEYGSCSTEAILMTDYNGTSVFRYSKYCSALKPIGQISLLNQGTFGYFKSPSQSPITATVDLLVTEVVPKQGSCPSGYFDCQNLNCVKQAVTCNGYNDCGNNRDETVGCGLAVGVIVGIVVGVSVFVIILVVLSLVFRRYRRRVTYVQYR